MPTPPTPKTRLSTADLALVQRATTGVEHAMAQLRAAQAAQRFAFDVVRDRYAMQPGDRLLRTGVIERAATSTSITARKRRSAKV